MASCQGTDCSVAFLFWVVFVSDTSHSQKQLLLQGSDSHLFLVEVGRMSEVMFGLSVLL